VAAPELSGWLADYGNDPRSTVRARILNVDEHGIRVGPELDCELQSIGLIVEDSRTGRQIEAGYSPASSPLLSDIARASLPATFTGVKRWPGTYQCDALIVWAGKE
jgi:hypothetical protein